MMQHDPKRSSSVGDPSSLRPEIEPSVGADPMGAVASPGTSTLIPEGGKCVAVNGAGNTTGTDPVMTKTPSVDQRKGRGPTGAEHNHAQRQPLRAIPIWVLIMSSIGIIGITGLSIYSFVFNGSVSAPVQETPHWEPSVLGDEWNDRGMQDEFEKNCVRIFDQEGCDLSAGVPPKFEELRSLEACRHQGNIDRTSSSPRLSHVFFLVRELGPTHQASRLLGIADRDLSCGQYLAATQNVIKVRESLADLVSTLDDILTDRNQHQSNLSAGLNWGTSLLENTRVLIQRAEKCDQRETVVRDAQAMRDLKLPFFVESDERIVGYLNEVFGRLNGGSLYERLQAYRDLAENERGVQNLPFIKDLRKALEALDGFDVTTG
ncbi:hypothetical protein ABC977_01990 [Thioalkalicoccus limnaeus]|uniref:Uncharacterized protein n=1 Tax=Thioalkalicoccus limnaeus TaxID=120681 RepID=A0ABV4BD70_9GAMM